MSEGASRKALIKDIVAASEAIRPDAVTEKFVESYYRRVPLDELQARTFQTLGGALTSHREFAQSRQPGQAKVAVINPTVESDGWATQRTVVMVVTDDMPFLVDSVTGAIVGAGYDIHLLVHPIFRVQRTAEGEIDATPTLVSRTRDDSQDAGQRESWILLTLDREPADDRREALVGTIESVLRDVRNSVEDWPQMRTKCLILAAELEGTPPKGADPHEAAEAASFLRWMAENHFTFLGYREYALSSDGTEETISGVPGTGLGVLRDGARAARGLVLSKTASEIAHTKTVLVLTKANSKATVHRDAYLDYVGVKIFGADGDVVGEQRFIGLYASTAYTESVSRIPLVSDKVDQIMAMSGVAPDSHTGKDLLEVLENYPRDELFQASTQELFETAMHVTELQERRRTKLFLRTDSFRRFVSALVFIPRDRYNTAVRTKLADILKESLGGESVEFSARVSESALSRLQFVVRMPPGKYAKKLTSAQQTELENQLVDTARTWTDRLGDALRTELGDDEGDRLITRFGRGFSTAYEETFGVNQGVADLRHLDRLDPQRQTSVALYRPRDGAPDMRRFKLFRLEPLSLTMILPIFADMGVEVTDEQPYTVTRSDGIKLHVYDFGLRASSPEVWDEIPHDELRGLFESTVLAAWDGHTESDGFNALVLSARLSWRQIVVLRMIAKYLRQAQSTYSREYVEDALVSNPTLARDLVELFEARFDPDRYLGEPEDRARVQEKIANDIAQGLEQVASLDHDRIIRSFLTVIRAALRTNFYQYASADNGQDAVEAPVGAASSFKPYVSLKLNPRAIPDLPEPRPYAEIWVFGPRVEGVHLRFGPVARGGLRWSDRREDFRTEILGLVKAQMVKNAVIVPTGSKGGFFAKQLPDPTVDRDAWLAEGVAAYTLFISGLLDLTDNRVGTDIVPPDRVVRHDGDDSYLVVAADKGTATFSDIANGVSRSYGFWLDDAFASGGSAGYDHKKMGITARGAWESVKRHFRELGVDTQTQPFTVVGVGDMSGDVFGNGMLLSEQIQLVAAFDHRHIFIDPTPDPASSFAERSRLFELPRSSWQDYNTELISAGGGVFARDLKSVPISEQMSVALGIDPSVKKLTPSELIHAVLLAPLDLLWNGGIGTYVKATSEDNSSVGDRANDAIRVNGNQLRVKVVGEGGNLGLTQLGRIEAALHGVRLNTDAVDNSAGVDTSDHEVNIKIPLAAFMRDGALKEEDRNVFLASMTDAIAEQVLDDNYEQNILLGNARAQQHSMLSVHQRLIHWLEDRGDLDRALEFLPSDADIARRNTEGIGLTSPEFAVLMAYSKLALKDDLLESTLPDDPWFGDTLAAYFPPPMREKYADAIASHPLRREIITNAVANSVINRGGITFVFRAMEETGATVEQVARAFVIAREVFGLRGYADEVELLDNVVPTSAQTALSLEFRRLLDRVVRWFLHARPGHIDIGVEIARFSDVVATYSPQIPELLKGTERDRFTHQAKRFIDAGAPEALALRAASLLDQYSFLDIVDLSSDSGEDVARVAPLYYVVTETFGIDAMLSRVSRLPRDDQWDAAARGAVRDDLYGVAEGLTRSVLDVTSDNPAAEPADRLQRWLDANDDAVGRSRRALSDIVAMEQPNLAALSVALRTLRSMIRAGSAS